MNPTYPRLGRTAQSGPQSDIGAVESLSCERYPKGTNGLPVHALIIATVEVLDLVAPNQSFSADPDHPITGDLKGEVLPIRLEPGCAC
jgi:hypothetical protein